MDVGTDRSFFHRRAVRTSAVLVAALLIGLTLGFGPALWNADHAQARSGLRVDSHHSVQKLRLPGRGTPLSPEEASARLHAASSPTLPPAPNARSAVATFLEAQRRGDQTAAYGMLSSQDRLAAPTPAIWRHSRPSFIPDVLGFSIGHLAQHGSGTEVETHLELRPTLDETVGLIPANATAKFATVQQDGGWRISLTASAITFQYLSEANLEQGASSWVEARQHCSSAHQWRTTLYGEGANSRAQALCGLSGSVRVGARQELAGRTDTAAFVAAFGPQAGLWARVVPVASPAVFDLVLAPLDRQWVVIGVLSHSLSNGQG